MIYKLRGSISEIIPAGVVIEVAGVGYHLECPLRTIANLSVGSNDVTVWVYTHVREDAIRLFGFGSVQERQTFATLIGLNGVGPKVGLAILSTLSVSQVLDAAAMGAERAFEGVPGIGKRLAAKIIVELGPRLEKELRTLGHVSVNTNSGEFQDPLFLGSGASTPPVFDELESALVNLGYGSKDVKAVVKFVRQSESSSTSLPELIRGALSYFQRGSSQSNGQGGLLDAN